MNAHLAALPGFLQLVLWHVLVLCIPNRNLRITVGLLAVANILNYGFFTTNPIFSLIVSSLIAAAVLVMVFFFGKTVGGNKKANLSTNMRNGRNNRMMTNGRNNRMMTSAGV